MEALSEAAPAQPAPPLTPETLEQLENDIELLSDADAKELLEKYAPLIPALAHDIMDKGRVRRRQRELRKKRNHNSYHAKTKIHRVLRRIVDDTSPDSSYYIKFIAVENMLKTFRHVMSPVNDELWWNHLLGEEGCQGWDKHLLDLFAYFTAEELWILAWHPLPKDPNKFWIHQFQWTLMTARNLGFLKRIIEVYAALRNAALEVPSNEYSLDGEGYQDSGDGDSIDDDISEDNSDGDSDKYR
ncbi:hypothetical protein PG995_000136 [Apiospora arundinis]